MLTRILLLLISLALLPALPLPAAADSPLTMGVFPRRDAVKTRQMFQPLATYLSSQLKRDVNLVVPTDFPDFWQRLEKGEFQLIHYNQYHYIKAHHIFGHRAILMNEEHGRNKIRANILVRADRPVNAVAELRGQKILFGGSRGAMVSHIMAVDLLRSNGLPDNTYVRGIALNPVAAVLAMYYSQADASSGSDSALRMPDMPWSKNGKPLRVLAMSDPVAQLPWAVTPEIKTPLAGRIKNAMLKLSSSASGRKILAKAGLTGLHTARDKDYDPHRAIVARTLGEQY